MQLCTQSFNKMYFFKIFHRGYFSQVPMGSIVFTYILFLFNLSFSLDLIAPMAVL